MFLFSQPNNFISHDRETITHSPKRPHHRQLRGYSQPRLGHIRQSQTRHSLHNQLKSSSQSPIKKQNSRRSRCITSDPLDPHPEASTPPQHNPTLLDNLNPKTTLPRNVIRVLGLTLLTNRKKETIKINISPLILQTTHLRCIVPTLVRYSPSRS